MPNEKPTDASLTKPQRTQVKIWDLPVRFFHWAIVLLFIAAYVTNSLGPTYFKYHLWSGYAMILLVSFRIVWGFVGTHHARFANFIKNPAFTLKYAVSLLKKSDQHYLGHNPLGAIMVVILLVAILIQAMTGLFSNDEIFNLGPLYGYISDELSLKLTSIHRQLFYWISGAVALHIAAVLVHIIWKRDNIIKAMFTGKKSIQTLTNETTIHSSKTWLAIIILAGLALILAWVLVHAPEAVIDSGY